MTRELTNERSIDFRFAPDTSWTLICRPDDPHKTLVREDGALLYGFEQTHLGGFSFRRTIEFSVQTGDRPTAVRQRTESAAVPIVETTIDYPTCRLQLRTAGHQAADGSRYDVVLWSIRSHDAVSTMLTGLRLDIAERDQRHAGAGPQPDHRVFAVDSDQMPEYPLFLDDDGQNDDRDEPAGGPPQHGELLLVATPQRLAVTNPSGFRPASGFRTELVAIRGGRTLEGAVIIPLDGGPAVTGMAADNGIDLVWAEDALRAERAFWQSRTGLRLPIQVPDPDLQDMLIAAARNMLQAREPDADGVSVFQVGPTVYRGLWVVDGHFLLEAARYLDLAAEPRREVRPLLARVRPDGSINALADVADSMQHPHTKETAIGIATLVRQWELTGDDDWLIEVWPIVRDGVEHIRRLRAAALELPRDSPAYGLMPPAFADGGAAGIRPELTTALWTAAGLRSAARAAGAVAAARPDLDSQVETIERMAQELRADIDRVAARYAGTLSDGERYLPMLLPGSGRHHTHVGVDDPTPQHQVRPQTATWALAQAIWPGEVFAPDDPVVTDFLHLLELIDGEEGIPVETGWLPYRAVWTYYASFAAHVWLYADEPEKAVSLLYAMCNHAAPTRVWREEQSLRSERDGRIWGDMPHNWASAELIRLVRHLAVFECGAELRLLRGVPRWWLEAGTLSVSSTPTRFGRVDVEVDTPTIGVTFSELWQLPERCVLDVPEGEWHVSCTVPNSDPVAQVLHGPRRVTLPLPRSQTGE